MTEQKQASTPKLCRCGCGRATAEIRAYAEAEGITRSAAWKRLHPERAKEYTRRDLARPGRREAIERHAATAGAAACARCGRQLGPRTKYVGTMHCRECWTDVKAERHRERDEQIEAWWAEGLTMRQIADRLDWSFGHLAQEVYRLRERGRNLPYRNRRANPKFGGQVVA